MIIKKMLLNDLEQVLKIEKESYKNPWNEKHCEYEVKENESSHCYCLLKGEEIIGYYFFLKLFDEANLTKITVKKEYNGRGYGNLLLEDFFTKAKELKCFSTFLEVRSSNYKAISLYEKKGYKINSFRKKYYEGIEDAYIMEKIL